VRSLVFDLLLMTVVARAFWPPPFLPSFVSTPGIGSPAYAGVALTANEATQTAPQSSAPNKRIVMVFLGDTRHSMNPDQPT